MQTPETLPDEDERATVTREIEIEAPVEDVWEVIATESGRDRWLEPDPDRILIVEREQQPNHIAWWWWAQDTPATHVEIEVVAIPLGARVIVTETGPAHAARLPLALMAAAFQPGSRSPDGHGRSRIRRARRPDATADGGDAAARRHHLRAGADG